MLVTKILLAPLALVAACGSSTPEFEEVLRDQREIFRKLGRLERSVEVAATPAAAPAAPEPKKYPDKVYDIPIAGAPVKGAKAAPVTIVEFADFQCPPCAQSRTLVKQVLDAYPKDVRFVYKQYPLTSIHHNAMNAAKAALAAEKQGKFWEMHEVLYANQSALGVDKLTEYAGTVGLDVPRWVKDFSSADVRERVASDVRDGQAADVDSTPTFFVNGKRMPNERSLDAFKTMIEGARRAGPAAKH